MRTLHWLFSIASFALPVLFTDAHAEWVRGGVQVALPSSVSDFVPVNAFVEPDGRIHVFMRPTLAPCVCHGVTCDCPPNGNWRDQRLDGSGVLDPAFPVDGRDLPVFVRGDVRASSVIADNQGGYFIHGAEGSGVGHLLAAGNMPHIWNIGIPKAIGPDRANGFFGVSPTHLVHIGSDDSVKFDIPFPEDDAALAGWDAIADGAGGMFAVWEALHDNTTYRLRVHRLNADGSFASTIPAGGHYLTDYPAAQRPTYVGGLAEPDGGILVAWAMPAGPVYAQRLLHDGTLAPGWTPGGVLVTSAGAGAKTVIVSDGDSGLYAAWTGPRVTHLLGNGSLAAGFDPSGLALGMSGGFTQLAQDDEGGAWVSWSLVGPTTLTLVASHIGPQGVSSGWPADGVPIVGNGHYQYNAGILDAPGGGAIVFWHDQDPMKYDPYGPFLPLYATRLAPDGTTAARTSLAAARREDGQVLLTWDVGDDVSVFTVERSFHGATWSTLDHVAPDASRRIEFVDRSLDPSTRAAYRLTWTDEIGALQSTEPAWVEASTAMLHLAGFAPNPARSSARVSYTLATDAPADLAVYDLAGRLVRSQRLERPSSGPGSVLLQHLAPGVYVVRLRQGGLDRTARGVVLP